MNSPLISIIVPVYNAENELNRCVESILGQSFKNFELLLIDDGSSDTSGKLCDEFSENDKRIRVFHKNNGGVSSARNLGLQHASGDWICFIDSDDYVNKSYLLSLYTALKLLNSDLVQAGFIRINGSSTQQVNCVDQDISTSSMSDILSHLRGFSISKLFNIKIIRQNCIKFDESLTIAEDLCFNLKYISHISSATFIHNTDYFYVYNSASASNKLHKPNSLLSLWLSENKILDNIQKKYNVTSSSIYDWKLEVKNTVFSWIISWIIFYAKNPFDKAIVKQLRTYYDDYIEVFKHYKLNSFIMTKISQLICDKRFNIAASLLFFISKYLKHKYKYEV